MNKPLFTTSDWDFKTIDQTWKVIEKYGKEWLGLDFYEPRFEIISADAMISNYCTHGLPELYSHWSFGKQFITTKKEYEKGHQGLAYELVINSNPAIVYLMENNTMAMMSLTMAHAAVGHCSVNKMNYLFKEWTNAGFILHYIKFAKQYIAECEQKYGPEEVEAVLDAAHMLSNFSIDKYSRKQKNIFKDSKQKYKERVEHLERSHSDLKGLLQNQPDFLNDYDITSKIDNNLDDGRPHTRGYPEENILYFIEKYSRKLPKWKREVIRIVRTIAQYFYPQMEIHTLHEGWASFVHYQIMTKMYEDGHLTDGCYLEFLDSHTAVCNQSHQMSMQLNPYKLGFSMFMDLKRVCESPDEEDRKWFPELCNTDWKVSLKEIMMNYKDDSFILQYLSPKVIRDLGLMASEKKAGTGYLKIKAIQDDDGVWPVREQLARQQGLSAQRLPRIEVTHYNYTSDFMLFLQYDPIDGREIDTYQIQLVKHYIQFLWGDPLHFFKKPPEELTNV